MHSIPQNWRILLLPFKFLLAVILYQPAVLALPQGGVVTQGQAVIQQESATKLNINQSTDRAVINWNSFSIGAPEWVNFQQPSSTSATLNRVTGNTPSSIAGKLTANGQIFLINLNGIAFLPTARVDVAGLVASTLNIKDSDFMRGVLRFEQMPGKPPASVINEGLITVKEAGFAALVAPAVQNSGVISARLGRVVLASGTTVSLDFYGDGLLSVTVDPQLAGQITDIYGNKLSSLIDNQGTITAPGGIVTLTAQAAGQIIEQVINTGGIIEAKYAEHRNGEIILAGGAKGTVAVRGVLDVSGEKGGKIQITGENVGLFGSAKVDASGDKAGGLVLIGGDYLGGQADKQRIDPSLNAQNTYVSSGSVINADAKVTGNGGEVIVWADNFTRFDGTITAKGDNGGFVETSGKNILQVGGTAQVDTTGRTGKTGTWLLDPLDLTISAAGDNNVSPTTPFVPTGTGSNLSNATLNTALGTTNVTLTTSGTVGSENGDIIFASDAHVNWSTANTFTVQAARRIVMQPGSKITSTNSGSFDAVIFQSNLDNIAGNFSGIELNNSTISTQGGNIQLIGKGGNVGDNNYGIHQLSGAQVKTTTGKITYQGTSGNGKDFNYGVLLEHGNTKIATIGGEISITGMSQGTGSFNHGIAQLKGAQVSTDTGKITYQGTAGNGINFNNGVLLTDTGTVITSDTGAISITGIGNGTGSFNHGIAQFSGVQVSTDSGDITYTGIAGNGTNDNNGVLLQNLGTKISSNTGTIKIIGNGNGAGASNYGIAQFTSAQVSTISGDITYKGTAGNGTDANFGVFLNDAGTQIKSDSGAISITGIGKGTGNANFGIFQTNAAQVETSSSKITYQGTGGSGTDANFGVFLSQSGTQVKSDSGAISITGIGQGTGNVNFGILQKNAAQVSTNTGEITYTGTGGNGVSNNYGILLQDANTKITSNKGTIKIIGNGNGAGASNYGIAQFTSAQVSTISGDITYKGTAGNGTDANFGVFLNDAGTQVKSDSGAINITGIGQGTGNSNFGIFQTNAAQVETSSSKITYQGTGGSGTDANFGVLLSQSGTQVKSDGGAISITGIGQGTGNVNFGILQENAAQVSTNTGKITYTGTGGNGAFDNYGILLQDANTKITSNMGTIEIIGNGNGTSMQNHGIWQKSGAQVKTTSGNITYTGTAGNGVNSNHGVRLQGADTKIISDTGTITITGNGQGSGNGNYGIFQQQSAQVKTTSGNIIYTGTGANAGSTNIGVFLSSQDTKISSDTGEIKITGIGQGSGNFNYGILQQNKAQVFTTTNVSGKGNITYIGTGGNGTDTNLGVFLFGVDTKISTDAGAIKITGTGQGSTEFNYGIAQQQGAKVVSTSGDIKYTGTGGNGTNYNYGVYFTGIDTQTQSDTGAISITGQGNGSGFKNYGIFQKNQAQVITATGNITYQGTGGNGTDNNVGIKIENTNTKIITNSGTITITGKGQGTGVDNYGIWQRDSAEVSSVSSDIIYMGKGANADAIRTEMGTNLIGNDTTGEIRLISQGGNVTLNDVTIQSNGEDVIIVSNDTVSQNSVSKILANGLALKGSGIGANYILNAPNNDVNFFAANVIGGVTYQDVNALTLDTVTSTALTLTVTGFTTGNGDGIIRTGNTLTLNKATNLGTGNLTLISGNGVTQNASGVITASGLGLQGTGTFDLNNANNDVNTLAAQVNGGVSFKDSDDLTIGGPVTSTVGLDSATTTAGLNTSNNDAIIETGDTLSLNAATNVGTGNLTLISNNGVTQTGAGVITASGLGLQGTGTFDLNNANNDVNTLAAQVNGGVSFKDSDDLTIGGPVISTVGTDTATTTAGLNTSNNDAIIQTGNTLSLNAATNVGTGNLTLISNNGVTQTGAGVITASGLGLQGTGTFDLNNANNDVNTLAAQVNGGVSFKDSDDLTIGGPVTSTVGLDSATTTAGLNTSNNDAIIQTGDTLSLNAATNVGTGNLTLISNNGVTQTGAGVITASGLGLQGTGTFDLNNANNDVNTLAAQVNGGVSFKDSDDLTIGGPVISTVGTDTATTTAGLNTSNNDAIIQTGDTLSLNAATNVGTGNLTLISNNGVTQSALGAITASGLGLQGTGTFDLNNANNDVNTLAAQVNGGVTFKDSDDLTIGGPVTSTVGTDTATTTAGLNTNNKDAIIQTGNTLSLNAATNVGTGNLTLISNNGVTQSALGVITASGLGLQGTGTFDLNNANNDVNTLAAQVNGGVSFKDSDDLTIGGPVTSTVGTDTATTTAGLNTNNNDAIIQTGNTLSLNAAINVGTGNLTLISGNGVTQNASGVITASGLGLQGTGTFDLNNANNDVNTLAAQVNGGVSFKDSDDLTIGGPVTSTVGTDTATTTAGLNTNNNNAIIQTGNTLSLNAATNVGTGNLTLISNNGVTQNASGVITASGLGLQGTGTFDLNNANNNVDTFAAQVTGKVSLVNSDTVTVDTVTSTVGTDTTTTSAVNATGNVFIQTKTGDIVLNKGVLSTAGNITLVAEDNFINNVGAGALSAPNGKWLVYATSPSGNVNGWPVLGGSQQFSTTFPTGASFGGNGFLYKVSEPPAPPVPPIVVEPPTPPVPPIVVEPPTPPVPPIVVVPPIVPFAEQPPTFTFISLLNQNQEQWFSLAELNAREVILLSETFLCTTVPVNQEEEEAKSFTLFVLGSEGRVQIPMQAQQIQTYWQPGKFPECKGETDMSLR